MAEHLYRDSYLEANLTFEDDKITWHCPQTNDTREVMMDWEQPIMTKMAEVAVEAGDHVLECGFGMGILSNAVQARNPASHTIVECHPQVLVKLNEWAADKPNVIVKEGKWADLIDEGTRYDSILMDTYVDDNLHEVFDTFAETKANDGCKVSWWNFSGGTTDEWMMFYWNNVTFTEVTGLNPPENTYYNRDNYFIPLKILNAKPIGYGVEESALVSISNTDKVAFSNVRSIYNGVLTREDTNNSTANVIQEKIEPVKMKCAGIWNINSGLLIITGNHPIMVKRDGSWSEKIVRDIQVGDKLYKIDNTEVNVDNITFDSSDKEYWIQKLRHNEDESFNYFANDILIKIK